MTTPDEPRRSFLLAMAALSAGVVPREVTSAMQAGAPKGYVLGKDDGEQLVHFRDRGRIVIKAGAATGSSTLAIGTQQVMKGTGIPTHRHSQMDEAFLVLAGSGAVTLDDKRQPLDAGSTVFIPRNSWHGFENPDRELLLLWTVSPAGLDGFFRETCSPPGTPPNGLSPDQIRAIARKYGTEFK